jgi:serine/threonine-protein kinase
VVNPVAPDQIAPKGRKGLLLWSTGAVLAAIVAAGLYVTLRPLDSDLRTADKPAAPPATTDRSAGTPSTDPSSGSPATPTSDLDALIQTGRYDEALKSARSLIANPPASGLPVESLVDLAKQLRGAGRPAEAFTLVEAMMETGAKPLAAALWPLAQDLRAAGLLDPYFFLARTLANQDYGPAAFALAEMYDPLHWTAENSPIKPRTDKAREWYEKAAALGIPEARGRLEALKARGNE